MSAAARTNAFVRLALWFVAAGVVIGLSVGLLGSRAVGSLGLDQVNLPPIVAPSAAPTTAPPTEEPSPEPTEPADSEEPAKPTFSVDSAQVAPGDRFRISGTFPDVPAGTVLDVEVRDEGQGEYESFAGVTTTVKDDGSYTTVLYTSRTGAREFRVRIKDSDTVSPSAKITIG